MTTQIHGELRLSADTQRAIYEALQVAWETEQRLAEQSRGRRFRKLGMLAAIAMMVASALLGLPMEPGLGIGALAFFITNTVARNMLKSGGNTFAESLDAGTAAVVNIYDGTAPADADASETNNLLAQLTCSATAIASDSDANPGGRITFDTITSDSSADATGSASHFRILTQSGGTVVCQGSVGTGTHDLVLNTVSITSGSTVSITSATVTLPEG